MYWSFFPKKNIYMYFFRELTFHCSQDAVSTSPQEGCAGNGESTEKGNEANKGTGGSQLWGKITSTELILSGEETLERGYDFNVQIPHQG